MLGSSHSPRVVAWVDHAWVSLRPDSDLLVSRLSTDPLDAHVQRWKDAVVMPFRPVLRAYGALRDELLALSPTGVLPTPDDREQSIDIEDGRVEVLVGVPDHDGHYAAAFTPSEARALAERLTAAADEAGRA